MENLKRITIATILGLALFAQLLNPSLAYADGTTPPPPSDTPVDTSTAETTEAPTEVIVTEPPTETATPEATSETPSPEASTETAATESSPPDPGLITPSAAETTPAEPVETSTPIPATAEPTATVESAETSSPTPDPAEISTAEATQEATEPTLTETLDALPEDTSVVVLDVNGQPLPLAEQETAEIIANSDPVWCPAGQAPTPGANGCTTSYMNLTDLVAVEGTTISQSGTIWITSGYVPEPSSVYFEGLFLGAWAYQPLTLQGGWSGISGDSSIGSNSVFPGGITIASWSSDVTINNITAPYIEFYNPSSDPSTEMGDVTVDHVETGELFIWTNSSGKTHRIRNTSVSNGLGAYIQSTGLNNVIVEDSRFDHNTFSGLHINSDGDVTLNRVTASYNSHGVYISQARNVSITGSTFNDNANSSGGPGSGAYIVSTGTTSIDQTTFNRNSLYIDSTGNVDLSNVIVESAQGTGLAMLTRGNVTIDRSRFISSVPNFNMTSYPYGDGANISSSGGNVTVTDSEFSGNDWGLGVAGANQLLVQNGTFDSNNYDITFTCYDPVGVLMFALNFPDFLRINLDARQQGCTQTSSTTDPNNPEAPSVAPTVVAGRVVRISEIFINPNKNPAYRGGKAEFWLNCVENYNFKINLPNGDRVDIYCPVSGKATITRLDNTTLPAELPTGYIFASAFEVEILQPALPLTRDPSTGDYQRTPVPVIAEGGHIMASFVATPLQAGKTFSILYWDESNSRWIPLKDYLTGSSFYLFPENPADERKILSGVLPNLISVPRRVQVTTNFPGIFVLAQH